MKALASGLKRRWKSHVGVKEPLPSYLAVENDAKNLSTEKPERGAKLFAGKLRRSVTGNTAGERIKRERSTILRSWR